MSQYKHEHELFVAGNNGTSFTEIAALTSIPCIGCFSREILLISYVGGISNSRRFFLDFLTLVMPSAIAATLMNSYIGHICAFLLVFSLLTYYLDLKKDVIDSHAIHKAKLGEQKSFIVWYRSIVNLMTAIAILAVDFPVFPRRLAKSETYGFGGMDNGVGFFVIANAIVSPEARGKHYQIPVLSQLRHSLTGCIPLLLLGFGRLLAVKGTDYHEHVTEYGVHWNFFFTLAALKLMSTLLYCLISVDQSLLIGVAVTALQQVLLSKCGLSNYIINGLEGAGSRVGILDANKEGIFSIPGYLAIYIFGVALGQFLFKKRENIRAWLAAAKYLFLIIFFCTAVMIVLHRYVEPVSRRLANATFVFWIVGNGSLMLLECLLAEIAVTVAKWGKKHGYHPAKQKNNNQRYENSYRQTQKEMTRPGLRSTKGRASDLSDSVNCEAESKDKISTDSVCLLEAVSYNALLFFLMANVMTGLINMSMRTMYASRITAIFVITFYLFLLCLVFVALRRKNIRTKVW